MKDVNAVMLGTLGGQARTSAKRRAARTNGALGGRRLKFVPGDAVLISNTARSAHRGKRAVVVGRGRSRGVYCVRLEDGRTVDVMSWCCERRSRAANALVDELRDGRSADDTQTRSLGSLTQIAGAMHEFVSERGWYRANSAKPQTAKNLAVSLVLEVSELLEAFQWTESAPKDAVSDELADIILYAAQIANVLEIDLDESVRLKLQRNRSRTWK